MNRLPFILSLLFIIILIDIYVYSGLLSLIKGMSAIGKTVIKYSFIAISCMSIILILLFVFNFFEKLNYIARVFIFTGIFIVYLSKVFFVVFLLIDDIVRFIKWMINKSETTETLPVKDDSNNISRSNFILKSGLIVAALPMVSMSWGIISGAHDYRVRRIKLPLKNLPPSFDGLKIVQVSDIHSGSFWNKTAVQGGIEMIANEKPDMIFFTGDLVNNQADEMKEWIKTFSKIQAPLGVFSTLGNHDYGDYVSWNSPAAKAKNLQDLKDIQKAMGWNLLINENRIIEVNNEKIAIVGVENWGARARFPKYGQLAKAMNGTENVTTKLLLSHDPSHWKAQVLPLFKDIDATFSGHTHGMQAGIEIKGFKWSPAQYVYDEWAGLYQEGEQYLYVNRGFGYIGYPGRIGIAPEITTIELIKA